MFATVTFIYSKITKTVPTEWIIDYEKNAEIFNKIFFCFWSPNLTKQPIFDMNLYRKEFSQNNDAILKVKIARLVGKSQILHEI